MKKITFTLLAVLVVGMVSAKTFTVNAHLRNRTEHRNGYRMLRSENNNGHLLVSQQTRVGLNYSDTIISFRFSLQDARVWGQNWNNMSQNNIHLHEAWIAYNLNPSLNLKIGRQVLNYDDQRLIAPRNFSLTTNTYDAALLTYKAKGIDWHFVAMINNQNESNFLDLFDHPFSFKYVAYTWLEKSLGKNLKINAINFLDLSQNPQKADQFAARNTLGANLIFSEPKIGFRAGGYYQFGDSYVELSASNKPRRSLSAYSYNSTLWAKPSKDLRLALAVDVYSGHNWSTEGPQQNFTGFNRLMAGPHPHLGFIDYFTSMDLREVKRAGIVNPSLRADWYATNNLSIQATFHCFRLEKPYLPVAGGSFEKVEPRLGNEIDLVLNYKPQKWLNIEFGFMTALPTETMKLLKGTGTQTKFSSFSYLSLQFSPTLFAK